MEKPPQACCWCGGVDPEQLEVTLEPTAGTPDGGMPEDDAGS